MLTFLVVEDTFFQPDQGEDDMANAAKRGFFRGAMDALVEARSKQATRYVNSALLMLDDETLRSHGYTRAELRKSAGGSYLY